MSAPAPGQTCSTTVPPPPMKWNYEIMYFHAMIEIPLLALPHTYYRGTQEKKSKQTIFVLFSSQTVNALDPAHHATVYDVNCNAPIWPARGPCLIAFNLGYITACGQTIFWLTACGQTITASGQLICTGSGQVTASGCRLLGVRHLDAV